MPRVQWSATAVEDLIDIVVSLEDVKQTLLIKPTNRPTAPQYDIIQKEMAKRLKV